MILWLAVIALAVAGLLLAVWLGQRRLIYFPLGEAGSPAEVGLAGAQEVAFDTEDGLRLSAWFLPAAAPPAAAETSVVPALLVFPGNAGNRSFRAPLAAAMADAGLAVLLVDYRGYGGNDGRPSESGLAADARAARRYLGSRPEVDPERIVYFGESLGSGVAVGLASERAPAALVVRSPFRSLSSVARAHYPFLSASLLRDRYPSEERIGGVGCPLLVIRGDRDRIVPPEDSLALFRAAAEPKRLITIEGAGHNDHALLAGDVMVAAVVAFLEEEGVLNRRAAPTPP
jgi:fermentation-respiration switch protein FrsA (DUF1100 family)